MLTRNTAASIAWLLVPFVAWGAVHLVYADTLIVHDSWSHIFPFIYNVTKQAACGSLPSWLGMVDSGSPLIIYVISFSLTQLVRVPLLYLMGCLHPDVLTAMYLYKIQIYLTYLAFGLSMYLLGRVLFRQRVAAAYLFSATLFAGLCLDSAHSNQVVSILFWVPWLLVAAVLYHRNADRSGGALYLNAFVLFFCLQLLDQYPHFIVLATTVAAALYLALEPSLLRATLRQIPRLWPALIVLSITAGQLLVIRNSIADYVPSLRSDLIVDPRAFGETGFVQPTAFIGSFLPLGFVAGFDSLGDAMGAILAKALGRSTGRMFIFRLDSLVFYAGMIPTALAFVFACHSGLRKIRLGWLLFTAIMLLVSLQQSKLYLLLFHVPFFNVFRSYFLYIVFVAFAVLVMSGYGLDVILQSSAEQKRALFRRAVAWLLAAVALSAAGLAVLIFHAAAPHALLRSMALPLLVDLALIAAAVLALYHCCHSQRPERAALIMLLVLGFSQSVYFAASYRILGTTVSQAYENFGLDGADRAPRSDSLGDAGEHRRKLCTRFAQCYLSQRHTVSLNTDLQGTFLRHREEPVFQPGLARPVLEALTGLTHPAFWFSRDVVAFDSKAQLVSDLNAAGATIGEALSSRVHVKAGDLGRLGSVGTASSGNARIERIDEHADTVRISYRSDHRAYLNAAINFDRHWRARVDGQPAALVPATFGGIALHVPAGRGVVELEYKSHSSDYFFLSRYCLILMSLVVVVVLARQAFKRQPSGV